MQRTYDAEGNLLTVTEIESPWTDEARAEAEALIDSDLLICGMCGNLREDCGDPTKPWFAQRHICYASREQSAADRLYAMKHDEAPFHSGKERAWAKKATKKQPYHYRDGVRVWVASEDLSPDDHFI